MIKPRTKDRVAPTSTSEQIGLQRAIAKALEREAKEKGTWIDPNLPVQVITYSALYTVYGKPMFIHSTDFETFKNQVEKLQQQFPKLKPKLFQTEETK